MRGAGLHGCAGTGAAGKVFAVAMLTYGKEPRWGEMRLYEKAGRVADFFAKPAPCQRGVT